MVHVLAIHVTKVKGSVRSVSRENGTEPLVRRSEEFTSFGGRSGSELFPCFHDRTTMDEVLGGLANEEIAAMLRQCLASEETKPTGGGETAGVQVLH